MFSFVQSAVVILDLMLEQGIRMLVDSLFTSTSVKEDMQKQICFKNGQ